MKHVEPYTALASIYDRVMDHVDYDEWAGYVDALLALHVPDAYRILELGAGTGRLAERLALLRDMRLTVSDGSGEMLARAEARLGRAAVGAEFACLDFTDDPENAPASLTCSFDAVLLLYDGFNYALTTGDAANILAQAATYLAPGGVFIFDHVTPANSTNADHVFEDEGSEGGIEYSRTSEFDGELGIHRTTFTIRTAEGSFFEEHRQRIWTTADVDAIVAAGPLEDVAAWDGFTLKPATSDSERIHRVLRCPDDAGL